MQFIVIQVTVRMVFAERVGGGQEVSVPRELFGNKKVSVGRVIDLVWDTSRNAYVPW